MIKLVPVIAVVSLVGCFRDKPEVDLTLVSVGMEKAEVLAKLGKPTRVSLQGLTEYLEYEAFENSGWDWKGKRNFRYLFVRIINGRVESFGNKGDFDTTKTPTRRIEIDQQVRVDTREEKALGEHAFGTPFDLKVELEKLDKMKKDGLLTDSEFKELRQRAIDKAKAQ
jgi:hypothetical protein